MAKQSGDRWQDRTEQETRRALYAQVAQLQAEVAASHKREAEVIRERDQVERDQAKLGAVRAELEAVRAELENVKAELEEERAAHGRDWERALEWRGERDQVERLVEEARAMLAQERETRAHLAEELAQERRERRQAEDVARRNQGEADDWRRVLAEVRVAHQRTAADLEAAQREAITRRRELERLADQVVYLEAKAAELDALKAQRWELVDRDGLTWLVMGGTISLYYQAEDGERFGQIQPGNSNGWTVSGSGHHDPIAAWWYADLADAVLVLRSAILGDLASQATHEEEE